MTLTSHLKRIFTALLLLPVLIYVVAKGGLIFLGAVILISVIAQMEFYRLFRTKTASNATRLFYSLAGGLLLYLAYRENLPALLGLLVGLFLFCQLLFLFSYSRRTSTKLDSSLILFSGLFYVPLLLQFGVQLKSVEIFYVLLATWATDVGAYYAGTYLGKKKIWPRISPKKSWAGSFGGMGLCIATSLVMGHFFGDAPIFFWIAAAVVLNLAAQFGDFFESALKRSLDVKDSGHILPGHGGMLDRIDSLLFVLPAYALLTSMLSPFGP